jgi:hypothetical protein
MATNPFAGLNLPSPQQIKQLNQQRYQEMWASGNPYAMQQATFSNFLDSIFGNPTERQAKKVMEVLSTASQNVFPEEGDTDVDTEIRRLRAMRDAVAETDPQVASQLNMQMLQLGQVKLEQDKLKAEQTRAANADRRAEAKEGREAALFPLEAATKGLEFTQNMSQGVNYMHPQTGEMVNVPANDALQRAELRARGFVEAGKPTLQGSKSDVLGLTKPVTTDLQTSIVNSAKQLDAFAQIAQKWNPSFLTLPTQAIQWANKGFERLTGQSVSADVAAQAQQYYDFRVQTQQALNSYIKSITGAQAAVAEYERLEKSFPNMNMGPTEYLSALRESVKNTIGINKRAQQALLQGLNVTPEMQEACQTRGQPCIWDSISTPPVSDQEVDAFLQRFGVPPRTQAAGGSDVSLEERLKKYRK